MISVERARELLDYNPKTGILTWKADRGGGIHKGDIIEGISNRGYKVVRIDGVRYQAHRLAWLIHSGTFPQGQIDHINGVKTDNRLSNIRDVSHRENTQNRAIHRKGKLTGATLDKRGNRRKCWISQAKVNRKTVFIGMFFTKEEAHEAYMNFITNLNEPHTISDIHH